MKENGLVGFINKTDKVVNFFSERHLKSRVEVKLFIFCIKFLHVFRLLDQTIMCQWTGLGAGLDLFGILLINRADVNRKKNAEKKK